jgi:hypothetical protein
MTPTANQIVIPNSFRDLPSDFDGRMLKQVQHDDAKETIHCHPELVSGSDARKQSEA